MAVVHPPLHQLPRYLGKALTYRQQPDMIQIYPNFLHQNSKSAFTNLLDTNESNPLKMGVLLSLHNFRSLSAPKQSGGKVGFWPWGAVY